MIVFNDVVQVIQNLVKQRRNGADTDITQLLLPVLFATSPDEDLDLSICSLYRGVFENNLEYLIDSETSQNISRVYIKINILLRNSECSLDALRWLSTQPCINKLSPKALLAGAKELSKDDTAKAFLFWRASIVKIADIGALSVATGSLPVFHSEILGRNLVRTKIAIVGNCVLRPLAEYLKVGLIPHGVLGDVWEAPFDQWVNLMLDETSALIQFSPAFTVIYLSSLGLTWASSKEQLPAPDVFIGCLEKFLVYSTSRVVLVLPEPLDEERDASSKYVSWRQQWSSELWRRVNDRVILIDPIMSLIEQGRKSWYAPRYWYHAKLPFHPDAFFSLGRTISLTIVRSVVTSVKVVICDLDNTLWGGVVGEDGWQNLELDVHGLGGPYIRLQSFLKGLVGKGLLLVAVSKNNENDVREVFVKREEMLLKWDDFTLVIANWSPKSENIALVSKMLNLGLGNFCFLDDSEFEREEVSRALPDVIVVDLPFAPEDYVSCLVESGLFHLPIVTDEDKHRRYLYRNKLASEEALQQTSSVEKFLAGLGLQIYPMHISTNNLERVVQLVNKTNQFNLTTRRYDHESMQRYMLDKGAYAYCYRILDKFGDNGITGVVIAMPYPQEATYIVNTWLLSCRVMGRTVERAIFVHLVDWLKVRNVRALIGEYIPTPRNRPVENLYSELGFTIMGPVHKDSQYYQYLLQKPYIDNKYVQVIQEEADLGGSIPDV